MKHGFSWRGRAGGRRLDGHRARSAASGHRRQRSRARAAGNQGRGRNFQPDAALSVHRVSRRPRAARTEAMAAARELSMNGPEKERPWGLVALANSMGPPDFGDVESLDAHREAALAVPDFPMPVEHYANLLRNSGVGNRRSRSSAERAKLVGNGDRISEEFRGQFLAAGDAPRRRTAWRLCRIPRRNSKRRLAKERQSTALNMRASAESDRYLQHDVRAGDADLRRYGQMLGYSNNANKPLAAFLPRQELRRPLGRHRGLPRGCSGRKRWVTVPRSQMQSVPNVQGLIHFVSMLPAQAGA